MARAAKFFGLVPAGGAGRRFGGAVPKQYARLGEKTVIEYSVSALLADARVGRVFVVFGADDTVGPALFKNHPQVVCLPLAGVERVNTVLNAVNHLLEQCLVCETDWLLVHDAARPGLRATDLSTLMDVASEHVAGGLLATPVADTLKRTAKAEQGEMIALQTVSREALWAAQTPQMFRAQALSLAMTEALFKGALLTDEASAIETMGISPLVVRGHLQNMKITQPEDLGLVSTLMGLERTSNHD